ncbi:MAG TPA: hypothetical protein VHE14_07020, partial [Solirubrobacteraceae bacterium]|nr:hypothetical protein [Solirubrobacteraceae bacterium]
MRPFKLDRPRSKQDREAERRAGRRFDPARSATRAFVRAVGRARAEGQPAPSGLRRRILLATIFRAMPRQIDARRAAEIEAVVEWRIRDGEGGVDIWTMTISESRCRVRRGGAERPRTRIELGTGDFFALV